MSTRGPITASERDTIIQLRNEGVTVEALSIRMGRSSKTICDLLKSAGLNGQRYYNGRKVTINKEKPSSLALRQVGTPSIKERIAMGEQDLEEIEQWVARLRDGTYSLREVNIPTCIKKVEQAAAYARLCLEQSASLRNKDMEELRKKAHALGVSLAAAEKRAAAADEALDDMTRRCKRMMKQEWKRVAALAWD